MRTRRSISTACFSASALPICLWRSRTSATCSPTGNAGLSEVIGSWKIIESLSPRRSRSRRGAAFSRSSPSKTISPPATRPGGCGTRPMIESAVTLLPQPDSPTMPSVRPRSRLRSTPSTARTSPRSEAKCVRSPRTSSRLFVTSDLLLDHAAVIDAERPLPARAALEVGDEALVRLFVEALELGQRIGVIVDADAEVGISLGRADEERRRLLAALVAARGLAGLQRGDQALGKRLLRCLVGARGLLDHLFAGEHVARDRKTVAGARPAPIDAFRAGVLADAALGIDDVQLAMVAALVGRGQVLDQLRRGHARAQQVEPVPAVEGIDQRLRRERAHAALGVRAERADGKKARRDRDPERPVRIARDDR